MTIPEPLTPPERRNWMLEPALVKFELSLDMYKLPMPVMERLRRMMENPTQAQAFLNIVLTNVVLVNADFDTNAGEEFRLVLTGQTAASGTVDIQ